MRLDKFLSQTGRFTRAEAKKAIKAKRVSLNGEIVKDGKIKVKEDTDEIFLDGKLLVLNNQEVYYMLNKPAGVVTATRDDKDKTVIINNPVVSLSNLPTGNRSSFLPSKCRRSHRRSACPLDPACGAAGLGIGTERTAGPQWTRRYTSDV